jgi:hypothetical protein
MIVRYKAHKTLSKFHKSDTFVRGIRGAIGSGKSVACSWEIFRRMQEQVPNNDGIRRTRWAIIRNTYRELVDTTAKTWLDWFGTLGHFNKADMVHYVKFGDVEAEILFRALDRPKDVKKLLSLELTGAWINEAREVPKTIVDMLQGRVGRFPSVRDGGCTWFGVIMDTNPPDTDHWWYRMFEEEKPENWEQFVQPSGLSPEAENIENLPKNYYQNLMAGKTDDWIKVYVHGEYGITGDNKPVYPEYIDSLHVAGGELKPIKNLGLILGFDFGLTPACVIGQLSANGQLRILDELFVEEHGGMGIRQFVKEVVKPHLYKNYKDWMDKQLVYGYGDPAGNQRSQTDETTCIGVLCENGIPTSGAYTNQFLTRKDAVSKFLIETVDNQPRILISPKCQMIRKGFNGGYKYERVQVTGDERYRDMPSKNKYSHIHDALQYLCMMVRSEYYEEKVAVSPVDKRIKKLESGVDNRIENELVAEGLEIHSALEDLLWAEEDGDFKYDGNLRRTI